MCKLVLDGGSVSSFTSVSNVFIDEYMNNIKNGLYQLGLGKIGNYDCCMSWYEINSSWKPIDGAKPYSVM